MNSLGSKGQRIPQQASEITQLGEKQRQTPGSPNPMARMMHTFAKVAGWEWGGAAGTGGCRLGRQWGAAAQDGAVCFILQDAWHKALQLVFGEASSISGQGCSTGWKRAGPQLVEADGPVLSAVGAGLQRTGETGDGPATFWLGQWTVWPQPANDGSQADMGQTATSPASWGLWKALCQGVYKP